MQRDHELLRDSRLTQSEVGEDSGVHIRSDLSLSGAPRKRAGAPRILVAEDHTAMRDLVVELFVAEGYTVTEVASTSEMEIALHECSQNSWPEQAFDMIVADNRMPGRAAIHFIERLRRAGQNTPILLMTAFPSPGLARHADELDVDLIAKPFSLGALRRAVHARLAH